MTDELLPSVHRNLAAAAVEPVQQRRLEPDIDHAKLNELACNIFIATAMQAADQQFLEASHEVL